MRVRRLATAAAVTLGVLGLAGVPATPGAAAPVQVPVEPPVASPTLVEVGRYATGITDDVSAEIVAYDEGRIYLTNGADTSIDVLDLGTDGSATLVQRVDLSAFGSAVTSLDAQDGLIAVAVVAPVRTNPGTVVFLNDETFAVRATAPVGALPDMLTFTPDGARVLVANEGEPSADYTIDPEGSVSIIRMATLLRRGGLAPGAVTTANFRIYDRPVARGGRAVPNGVRIFGPNARPSQDFEPEFITVSPDSATAYVSLQENNALGVIDVVGGRVDDVLALGLKDHALEGNGLDPSDRDDAIAISTWPVRGMYMPDGIASYEAGGELFVVTANEGDARDYEGFAEETRVSDGDYVLDPVAFPNAAALKTNPQLGRLTVTTASGDTDGDGVFEEIHAFGARSFSIRSADGELVFDSGDQFEQITAELEPDFFNSDNAADNFDNRSDNKGPEPEGVEVGVIDGRTYAFIGLERVGGVMVYDITDPAAPTFVEWSRTRVFGGEAVGPDSGPESIEFVSAADSPTGVPLAIVGHEVTGTVVVFEIREQVVVDPDPDPDPEAAATLTLLHNNDGESSLQPITNARPPAAAPTLPATVATGGIAAFATVTNREIADARGLGNSVVNVYAGDAFLASATLQCAFEPDGRVLDAVAQRLLPYDAHVFGNHEFDFGPTFLTRFIRTFVNAGVDQPFLSANLDFSAEPDLAALEDDDGLIDERAGEPDPAEVIARSMIVVDDVSGEEFGIVGATTPELPTISSPGGVTVTPDLATTAAAVQAELDRLQAEGIDKLILVSHLQSIDNDEALIALLDDVDIAVAGGGDELLANGPGELLPYEIQAVAGEYPRTVTDAGGREVAIVTTAGNYKYVGRLDVDFDADGEVIGIDAERSGPVRVVPNSPAATTLGVTDSVAPDTQQQRQVVNRVDRCLADFAATPIIRSQSVIDVSRNGVRAGESNGGNLVADSFLDAFTTLAPLNGLQPPSAANPTVAVQNGGGIRQNAGNSLPASGAGGIISRLDVINVLPFDNTLAVLPDVSPADLRATFEFTAAALGAAGATVAESGRFLQVAGMEIVYDRTFPTGSRVRELDVVTSNGTVIPIVNAGVLVPGAPAVDVVTNNFTADGGDGYATLAALPSVLLRDGENVAFGYERALREYLLSFPAGGDGIAVLPASDTRYSDPDGEDRIIING